MRILTSPAKLMKINNSQDFLTLTEPQFIEDSDFIQSYLKEKSPQLMMRHHLLFILLRVRYTEV